MIIRPSTFGRLCDDLETLAAWKEDLNYRVRRAELIFQSSGAGISEETREELLREGRAWQIASNSLAKRVLKE
jgi:hypothetical protein